MTAGILTVRFTSKGHVGSRLAARGAHAGGFNHCMIVDGDWAWEATLLYGVREVARDVAMRGVKLMQDMHFFVPDIEAARAFLRSVKGALYDWFGALGVPWMRSGDWQDPARWWCGELAIAALGAAGLWVIDRARAAYGTLRDLYEYPIPKNSVIRMR